MRKKYEYTERHIYENSFKLIEELNKLGQEGWIVVSIRYVPFFDDERNINRNEVILYREIKKNKQQ